MWDLEQYVDESAIAECKRSFENVYPEFSPTFLGASQDKTCLIAQADFPDGRFYFRVTERSVSAAYGSAKEADFMCEKKHVSHAGDMER